MKWELLMVSKRKVAFGVRAAIPVFAAGMFLFLASPGWAQSLDANFFVAVEGPTWGADAPPLSVSDQHCRDIAYAAGWGDGRWRAYMTGKAADGEGDQIARERIGAGPWFNYYGVLIAEDVSQLHSDANNLNLETAITQNGEYVPERSMEIPPGSQLDGSAFTREGPFFCFRLPG